MNEYNPDYAVPPGATIQEILDINAISVDSFATQMGLSEATINDIISGKGEITPEIANKLEVVLGPSVKFWNNRELHYRQTLVRLGQN